MTPISQSMMLIRAAEDNLAEVLALNDRAAKSNDKLLMLFANNALVSANKSLNAAKKTLLKACALEDAVKMLQAA